MIKITKKMRKITNKKKNNQKINFNKAKIIKGKI